MAVAAPTHWMSSSPRAGPPIQTAVTGEETADLTETETKKPVCLLDIPVHKTGRAFTKPVDPLVGEAIAAWEAVRPDQPPLIDEERAAVDGDVQALNRLLERLKEIPRPSECHTESRQKPLQTFIPVGKILSKP